MEPSRATDSPTRCKDLGPPISGPSPVSIAAITRAMFTAACTVSGWLSVGSVSDLASMIGVTSVRPSEREQDPFS